MALNPKAIEETAVDAVKAKIRLSPVLSSYISDNDKSPSFDGYICVHQNARQTKKGLKRVNVQVKGCEKKHFNKDAITYPMSIDDLLNFKTNGGCLLFVVYVRQSDKGFEDKVYYQELTPVKIIDILAKTKAKSKPSVLLKALPRKGEDIATIVLNCYENCRMQASFANVGELPQLDDLEKKGILEGFKIPFFGYGAKPKYPADLNNHDVYIYAKLKNSDVWQPVQGQPIHLVDRQRLEVPVTVAGTPYYNSYDIIHEPNSTTVLIGSSFRVKFTEGQPGCSMEYKGSNMLRTLYKDSSFILAAIENNGFETGGIRHEFDRDKLDLSRFNQASQTSNLKKMARFIQMLDLQGCTDDIDLTKLTAEDYRNLERLAISTVDHQPVSGLREDLPTITTIEIGSLRFALWLKQSKNDRGTYTFYNALDYLKPMYTGVKDKNDLPVPVAIIFDEEAYLKVSNIQFERLLPSFQRYSATPYIYDIANSVMLFMIGASDKASGERKTKLINTALEFAKWLESMPAEVWDKRVSALNRLQIIKRTRPLENPEKEELFAIAAQSADNAHIMAGTNILLERYDEVDFWLKRIPEDERKEFVKFPIFNLKKESGQ
ncbi:MAG: DUF4365 domain-containing protein [Clostridia bacterium]|nr:DUF4365 domain-containing protein [Clostridia bacterium]MBR1586624.1 DUF4365 domain-containing protein [Clostridia bacterium]